jgi:phosphatidylserine decarboxylase
MTLRSAIDSLAENEGLNFILTNRIPRRTLTRFMGWLSKVENPLVRYPSLRLFQLFCAPNLGEAKTREFRSLRDCFVRELAEGARTIDPDPDVLVSPCDGIVGAAGAIRDDVLLQVKGRPYRLEELLRDGSLARQYRDGCYATLRLTAGMYHHFHAPYDCRAVQVTHIPGDVWNVNPPALKRVDQLYCRNERAIVRLRLAPEGPPVLLVAVAAILVAGIRLRFLEFPAVRKSRSPATVTTTPCDATFRKGDELGWFEHGSTILVLAPVGFALCDDVEPGALIHMGQRLLRRPGP